MKRLAGFRGKLDHVHPVRVRTKTGHKPGVISGSQYFNQRREFHHMKAATALALMPPGALAGPPAVPIRGAPSAYASRASRGRCTLG